MDLLIARDWVAALRSGKYQQGRHALRVADAYCCLGVLCELAVERGVLPSPRREGDYHIYGAHGAAVLPQELREWAGLQEANGYIRDRDPDVRAQSLVELNDGGKSFAEIADIVERHADRL